MGCGNSKFDDLEAVVVCRQRSQLLSEAIAHRYAIADAHDAYSRCLKSVGEALHRFLEIESASSPPSPALQLPAQRKGEDLSPGHLHFPSDSDLESDDDEDEEFHLHSDDDGVVVEEESPVGPTVVYAKNQSPNPTISYEPQPMSPEIVRFGGGEGYNGYGYRYPHQSPNFYPYGNYGYPYPHQSPNFYPSGNYGYPSNYDNYGGVGGYFGSSSYPTGKQKGTEKVEVAPQPPSPPRVSNWEFLNLFDDYKGYYGNYMPIENLKELREEEGIPDLEDEGNEEKNSESLSLTQDSSNGDRISEMGDQEKEVVDVSPSEENVVDMNVVVNEVKEMEKQENVDALTVKRYHDLSEVVKEIKLQFDRASNSAADLSEMLEVGKQPYHQKNSVYKVSARLICGASPLSSSKDLLFVFEDDAALSSGNLSLTLHKLYMWEKKLGDEVVSEEKMRVVHDRICRKMKRLDQRGAEAHKLESALSVIRKLSTKIRIAIQVVDSISNKLSKIRDDELWPQISELIQGLMRMWSVMLECHRIQCQALSETKNLDSIASGGKIDDTRMEVTKQLELKLLEWVARFSAWIHAQKSFVKALNGWLFVGIRVVQEETSDGIAPFSPGQFGAPPVFVICNQWAQMIERISEQEVINAMNTFASNVLRIWEKHNFDERQKLMANREMDRRLKTLQREEQEMRRAVEEKNRKLVVYAGQSGIALVEHTEESNLQGSLQQIFEAMENFFASTLKAYEELNMRLHEERSAGEDAKAA